MSYGADAAAQLNACIYDTAAEFMLDDATTSEGGALGFADVLAFYWAGRLGPLGRVTPEVAAAAHGFLAPQAAAKLLPPLHEVCDPLEAGRVYVDCGAQYAEKRITSLTDEQCTRIVELATAVVDNVPGTALFAAWRAMPRPSTAKAGAGHVLNLLREWRAGLHIAAITAAGLTPLEAIMSDSSESMSRSSEFYAELFGWPKPWPSAEANAGELKAIASTVDEACGRFIEQQLSESEAAELVLLTKQACADLA